MKLKPNNKIRSITIGSFDGLHIAHQKLISQSDMVVVIERNGGYLTPGYKRSWYTDKPLTIYRFEKIRSLSPQAFIGKLQHDFPTLEKIIVGYDFNFGKEKSGNANILQELFDGEVNIIEEICINDIPVHSKTIKKLLEDGRIKDANMLLGREYRIDGKVIAGQGIGADRLVPTINIQTEYFLLPHEGVYATKTFISDKWVPSVSFIGHRVTTDNSFAIETHIIDQDIGAVTGNISIKFTESIRDNRKFDDLNALRDQISKDIQKSKEILS